MAIILTFSKLHSLSNQLHNQNKSIVLVTGVFDLLHQAHRDFLFRAKKTGDVLMVGLERDERVRILKGPNRPHDPLDVRLQKVATHQAVDYVFALPQAFHTSTDYENLIALILPAVYAVSSHSPHLDKKLQITQRYGGRLQIVKQHDKQISTTQLLKQEK